MSLWPASIIFEVERKAASVQLTLEVPGEWALGDGVMRQSME